MCAPTLLDNEPRHVPAAINFDVASGEVVTIVTTPKTGMNAKLKEIGRSYGVIKFVGGATDKPHWSTDGH